MTHYLLAAEADQIQDLIFRSARLRQVVGGSQLLTRFCNAVPKELIATSRYGPTDLLVADGGAFRLLFDDDGSAVKFGQDLAARYRANTGGRLSVGLPIELSNADHAGEFCDAHHRAIASLRAAKNRGDEPDAVAHLPYTAMCASCGVDLARIHKRRHGDERENYLCARCGTKEEHRDDEQGAFLKQFCQAVQAAPVAGETVKEFGFAEDAEDIGRYDPRKYVAYLAADGNSTGSVFAACDRYQLASLSQRFSEILRESLAIPAAIAHLHLRALSRKQPAILPVLPLILGGDDCFALIAAPYAVAIAADFCAEFEARINAEWPQPPESPPVTISAAVVICKANYPYALAHRRAELLLREAKRAAFEHATSAVAVDVVIGNELIHSQTTTAEFRDTLVAYPAHAGNGFPGMLQLLSQRLALHSLAGKRRAQLRSLFGEMPTPATRADWEKKLRDLLDRIGRASPPPNDKDKVIAALQALGDAGTEFPYWRTVGQFSGNGVGDLLRLWDFTLDLHQDPLDYEEAGR